MTFRLRKLWICTVALCAVSGAHADTGLIVSRTVYPSGANVPSIVPNVTVLPNGALAVGDGNFANVFKNETPDPSFGVTTSSSTVERSMDRSSPASRQAPTSRYSPASHRSQSLA